MLLEFGLVTKRIFCDGLKCKNTSITQRLAILIEFSLLFTYTVTFCYLDGIDFHGSGLDVSDEGCSQFIRNSRVA